MKTQKNDERTDFVYILWDVIVQEMSRMRLVIMFAVRCVGSFVFLPMHPYIDAEHWFYPSWYQQSSIFVQSTTPITHLHDDTSFCFLPSLFLMLFLERPDAYNNNNDHLHDFFKIHRFEYILLIRTYPVFIEMYVFVFHQTLLSHSFRFGLLVPVFVSFCSNPAPRFSLFVIGRNVGLASWYVFFLFGDQNPTNRFLEPLRMNSDLFVTTAVASSSFFSGGTF